LKNITELDVLKIENATTIRQDEVIASGKPKVPDIRGTEIAGMITAKIRGIYAKIVDRLSPNLDIILGAMKKTSNIIVI
jgi:hypothetical protein